MSAVNKLALVLVVLLLVCSAFGVTDKSPDELGIYGPKDGITTVEARWGNKSFKLALEGSYEDPKNQAIMSKWLSLCKKEVFK